MVPRSIRGEVRHRVQHLRVPGAARGHVQAFLHLGRQRAEQTGFLPTIPVAAVLRQLQPEGSAHPLRRVVQRSGCVLGHPQGPQPGGFVPD